MVARPLRAALLSGMPHAFSAKDGLAGDAVLDAGDAVRVTQVHSARVVDMDEARTGPVEADALVTNRAGAVLQIVTADCAPVLLADREARVIGAAHAGWRGALGGVLGNTVAAMVELGARPGAIAAAIGPTIARRSYEVDPAFRAAFGAGDEAFFAAGKPGHLQFDLPAYCAHRLREAGVNLIEDLAQDTYSQPTMFYSYRRATHAGKPTGGRQISAIALPPE